MILLQVWILLVILYPHFSVILAKNIQPISSPGEFARIKEAAIDPYRREILKNSEEVDNLAKTFKKSREEIEKLIQSNDELLARCVEKNMAINREYSRKMTQKMKLAQSFSILSPAVLFDRISGRMARTDIDEFDRFMAAVFRYKPEFDAWIAKNPVPKEDPPGFVYASESLSGSLTLILPPLFLMILMCVILYVLAYVSFLRKDLR